jgi:hypothetical protein
MRGGDSRRISRGATGRDGHLTPIAIDYPTLSHSRGERNGSLTEAHGRWRRPCPQGA